jgi:hypothetical protein
VPIVNLLMVTCNACDGHLRQAMFYEVRTATDTTLLPDGYRQLLPGLERVGRDRQGDGGCLRSGADREADGADDLRPDARMRGLTGTLGRGLAEFGVPCPGDLMPREGLVHSLDICPVRLQRQ